jgi:hypothetical protein
MTESENDRPRLAGGIFIALGLLVGAIAGVAMNQPSAGMITGFAVGAAIALIIWLVDRRKV